MARFSDTLVNQHQRPVAGALVYVTVSGTGVSATLTDDNNNALSQPLISSPTGSYYFNTDPGLYDLSIRVGGREVSRINGTAVGDVSSLPAGSVANFLGNATNVAPSQAAVALILSGAVPFNLPDEANGDAVPDAGSKLPYLSGGVLKIA